MVEGLPRNIPVYYLSKKIRLDFSCESSAQQRSHLKHQVLFSLKKNEKIFMNVVCCSRDWCYKGNEDAPGIIYSLDEALVRFVESAPTRSSKMNLYLVQLQCFEDL